MEIEANKPIILENLQFLKLSDRPKSIGKGKSKIHCGTSSIDTHIAVPHGPSECKISYLPKLNNSFVPTDPQMARIVDLLRVDLDVIYDESVPKKGFVKVDRTWIFYLKNVKWSYAFDEEGHLRTTRIMHMLPRIADRPNVHKSLQKSYRDLEAAAVGLSDYNKRNKGAEYYLVKPVSCCTCLRNEEYVSHANFLAKRKSDPESPDQLFFTEVVNIYNEVTVCQPVDSPLLPLDTIPPFEYAGFDKARIIHPEGFECLTCNNKNGDSKMLWHKLNHILNGAIYPETSDTPPQSILSLTKPIIFDDIKKKHIFVPSDPHMARILKLLTVDLNAIDDNVRARRGFAKVDHDWISKLCAVDWSGAFTEEGNLRLTRFFPMLPKLVDAHLTLFRAYRRLRSAALGLEDYNKRNKGAEFDLVRPINAHPVPNGRSFFSHANFLAKPKGDPESPVELFFAEVCYSYDEVNVCCPLETRLLPPGVVRPLEKAKFDRSLSAIHPEDFKCVSCELRNKQLQRLRG